MPKIKNMGSTTMRFGEGLIVTGSAGTDTHSLVVTGSTTVLGDITCNNINIGADASGTGRTISAGNTDTSIRFNSSDGVDIVVGGAFFLSCDENASQDTIVFNTSGHDIDFRVESDNKEYQIFSDAGNDLLVLGSDVATPGGVGGDTNIFVSGSIKSKDSSTRGTTVFGGDLVVSGALFNDAGAEYTTVSTQLIRGQVILTTDERLTHWSNQTVSATSILSADEDDIRSWFFFPYSARIKKVYLIAKQNISDDVTCRIYLNKTVIHASGPNATQTKLSSEFGSVSQTFGMSTTFSYKKAVYNFTLDVPAESVMQMSFQKGDGASVSNSDNIVVVVYETSLLMF